MSIGSLYLIVAILAVVLAAVAYGINRGQGRFAVGFTLMEIVIMAVIGVINGGSARRTPCWAACS